MKLLLALLGLALCGVQSHGGKDAVLLREVSVLTLYEGRLTNGRRSAGVPQLKCVGGTASGKFVPKVVQCYNRGHDGSDVQWECKTDMDNEYRFGSIQVSCEGYDYPDDPYILKGSCGLEYTLDYTKSGWEKKDAHKTNNYGYDDNGYSSDHYGSTRKSGIVEMEGARWHEASCTCPSFSKHYVCKHNVGIAIRLKMVSCPPEARSIVLGRKPRRGRPSKANKAFILQ